MSEEVEINTPEGVFLGAPIGVSKEMGQKLADNLAQARLNWRDVPAPLHRSKWLIQEIYTKVSFLKEIECHGQEHVKAWIKKDPLVDDILANLQEYKEIAEGF